TGSQNFRIRAELEHGTSKNNSDGQSWIFPSQWFSDYKNPSQALLAAAAVDPATGVAGTPLTADAYRSRIFNNLGAWIQDVRRVNQGLNGLPSNFDSNNNFVPPAALYTTTHRGIEYNNLAGNRVSDEKFNNRGRGTETQQTDTTAALVVEASPLEWLDVRYSFTHNEADYKFISSQANPYADGNTFNFGGVSKRGDNRKSETHQYDFVLKKEIFNIKNKLLLGGIYDHSLFNYYGYSGYLYTNIPGAAIDPSVPPALIAGGGAAGSAIQLQQLYSRTGTPLTATQVFSQFDPAVHTAPDVRRITAIDRAVVDRYNPKKEEYYVNYLATLLDDRLNLFAGYRTVNEYDGEQRVSPNPPWFVGFENMLESLTTPEQIARYGISNAPGSYHVGTYAVKKGDSQMFGASYEIIKDVTVYASYSKTFLPNTGFLGLWDEALTRQRAASLGLNPDAEVARVIAAGANTPLKNEEGLNMEVGVKTSLMDSKIVSTFSLFRLERTNEKLDDSGRQI
ncbi:MAG TPA: hypothetical protein PLN52_19645, partial [Opitutaceae bacterium]|nr:hypothetical protein [Opitutaceae bacterium]